MDQQVARDVVARTIGEHWERGTTYVVAMRSDALRPGGEASSRVTNGRRKHLWTEQLCVIRPAGRESFARAMSFSSDGSLRHPKSSLPKGGIQAVQLERAAGPCAPSDPRLGSVPGVDRVG